MSHYIVLVKQVPDVARITDNAFDPETGNLMRGKLASVINELDAQALAFAEHMKRVKGDDAGKIIALTMGPPMAADVLRYSLSRCADMAVLLTDRVLGGADTWATANPLAFAVRKIVADILGGSDDYVIVSGMQSVDGDTAQVPAQMAEELDVPCIAYATDVEYKDNRFEFTRIISGGSQVVAARQLPAVVTVAKYEYPVFATVAGTRRANDMELIQWSADDVKPTAVGVKGSKTRVIRVFPPPKTNRKCHQVKDAAEFVELFSRCFNGSSQSDEVTEKAEPDYILPSKRTDKFDRNYEGTKKEIESYRNLGEKLKELGVSDPAEVNDELKKKILTSGDSGFNERTLNNMLTGMQAIKPVYEGEVWVVAEISEAGEITPATYELVGKACELAGSLDTKVGVALAGKDVRFAAESLIHAGADKIYIVEDDKLEHFDPTRFRCAIASVIGKYWPQIVLYAATPQGRVLAPMVSYQLGCGLTADCTGLDIRDSSRKGEVAVLMQTRPALGGNVMATICTKDSRCQMATARPGVMMRREEDKKRTGEVIDHAVEIPADDYSMEIISTELGTGDVNLDADIVISGGKGLQSGENFNKILTDICAAVSERFNVEVERGASRAAVEQGYVDRVHQVGQTGFAISPKIYVAIGISGAIQHMIGVANSETVFAINNDPNAPIFKQCDYYIIGSAEEIIPQLITNLGAK